MRSEKVDFDLSILSLEQLVNTYHDITNFIQFLNDNKVEEMEENNE